MKYAPLETYLSNQSHNQVPMTFAEIERLLGEKLPPSARKHRPWWSNNPSNSVITHAWLRAGYKTAQVDMGGERLVFQKSLKRTPEPDNSAPALHGLLSGTIRVSNLCALEHPPNEKWDAERAPES
jgi:hypothetical protein